MTLIFIASEELSNLIYGSSEGSREIFILQVSTAALHHIRREIKLTGVSLIAKVYLSAVAHIEPAEGAVSLKSAAAFEMRKVVRHMKLEVGQQQTHHAKNSRE